jgi:hypothetical protein
MQVLQLGASMALTHARIAAILCGSFLLAASPSSFAAPTGREYSVGLLAALGVAAKVCPLTFDRAAFDALVEQRRPPSEPADQWNFAIILEYMHQEASAPTWTAEERTKFCADARKMVTHLGLDP